MKHLSQDDAIDLAYDEFLRLAPDALDPADRALFSLQFEQQGVVEILEQPLSDWQQPLSPSDFYEVVIGLAPSDDADIETVFARVLVSQTKTPPEYHFKWRE